MYNINNNKYHYIIISIMNEFKYINYYNYYANLNKC